ncbi:unnamed protein product [Periconia digitata]|uniref:Uncharacterized protein n=1 Tax=Periconia digitata TaxID=1303443 RepID=A0A9W4UQE1_9PLEO|nr:unnamed protein product [Periconia digitata]
MEPIKLHTLNSDILCDIILSCSTLSDLYNLIRTHPRLYRSFNDRRRLILKTVFRTQHQDADIGGKGWESRRYQDGVDLYLKKLKCKNPIDQVALREALWPQYQRTIPSERSFKWAASLLSWYQKTGLHQDALSLADKALKKTIRKPTYATFETQEFLKTVATLYASWNRIPELTRLLQSTINRLQPNSRNQISWIKQLATVYRNAQDHSDGPTASTYAEQRLELLRVTWETCSQALGPGNEDAKYFARELTSEYRARGDDGAITPIYLAVRDAMARGSPEYLAWSRFVIQQHRKNADDAAVLRVLEEVWLTVRNGVKGYRVWADELSRQYEAMGRWEDALGVWEFVWSGVEVKLKRRFDNQASKYDGKGTALMLIKLYRRYGKMDEARKVEDTCEAYGVGLW